MNNLTLSSFSKVGVSNDARLYIAKENTDKAYVAPEKFSSKVLTWLGKMPLFKKEGANKRGNSSRLTQSFHFFMFEPIFSPVNALNQPI